MVADRIQDNDFLPILLARKFELAADKFLNREALIYNGQSLTYGQLNTRVNQLAHCLSDKGLQKGDVVNIVLQRSIEAIVSILAVVKCGAVYVPVDATYPPERINFMIGDSNASLIITSAQFIQSVIADTPRIIIEAALEASGNYPVANPQVNVSASDPMYMIYTSGSTGKPKGAVVSHENIAHFLQGMQAVMGINEGFRMSAVYSISFDPSGGDYFMALTQGATLCIADAETLQDGQKLLRYIKSNNLTYFKSTPSLYRLLLDSGFNEKLDITFVSGGEPLPENLAAALLPRCNKLFNVYGPTECTIISTIALITESSNITIGKPLQHTVAYVLNEALELVQGGQEGELYISGTGVGLGYYNRPELTEKAFLPDPFSEVSGQKMYKTGDLVKINDEGSIVFLGRLDNQVKIRGYRIELGELEHLLGDFQNVKEVLVRPAANHTGEKILIAYIILKEQLAGKESAEIITAWRKCMQEQLPDFMVPSHFLILQEWPLLPNGKIDIQSLPGAPNLRPALTNIYKKPAGQTEVQLEQIFTAILGINGIGAEDNFFELGGNSLLAQRLVIAARTHYNLEIPITKLYQYPSIEGLGNYLNGHNRKKRKEKLLPGGERNFSDIAIIGMECSLPGAPGVEAFWEVLREGRETISFFKDEELDPSIPLSIKNDETYVKARGIVAGVDEFDASFFGINPKLAEIMDPQHRLFLMTARNLLEKTGYLPEHSDSLTGVFVGCSSSTYFNNNVIGHKDKIEQQGRFSVLSVTDKDYISTRTAYHLNLEGPAVNVNSACSTSLLAVAQAVDSLRTGACEVAIAGGASIQVPVKSGHLYQEGAVYSKDGHCRPFDVQANGTIFSDGVGAVLLKPLKTAEQDGDVIYGVIRGIGVNNDGGNKGSFSAPSAEGQAGAISVAIKDAKVKPAEITYIEAHGTATPLGDPIEMEGLNIAFGEQKRNQYCAIGSVKSNIGHVTHAAGVAGLIKAALCLHHKTLVPTINYTSPNPAINFEQSPFIVNNQLRNWEVDGKRIAGVSSFGVGGTNVHVIVEEYSGQPLAKTEVSDQHPSIINWSARTEQSLKSYAYQLQELVKQNPEINVADIAYTLQTTREHFMYRNSIVVRNLQDLERQLSDHEQLFSGTTVLTEKSKNLVFMFPGQGSQYINMGRELYNNETVYREAIDTCADLLKAQLGEDIRTVIFSDSADDLAEEKLRNTFYTQPAIFITSYALAKLYMSWGLQPNALAGHSVGEFVAAHLAGVFSLADALKIVANRARLISGLEGGSMLSVRTAADVLQTFLPAGIAVAAINAPNLCVVSGTSEAIELFSGVLTENGIANKLLRTSHAFHSHMMQPIINALQETIESTSRSIPRIPILSTVTGNWLKDEEAQSAAYWATHAREAVRFSDAVTALEAAFQPVFLEVGPGTATNILVKQHGGLTGKRSFSALDTASRPEGELIATRRALGKVWQQGVEVSWRTLYPVKGRVLHNLPTYAYDKKRYWLDPATPTVVQAGVFNEKPVEQQTIAIVHTPDFINNNMERRNILIGKIKELVESASGIDISEASPHSNFTEIGLDSLLLTQIAATLKKEFKVAVTFRQLNEECDTLEKLSGYLDAKLPADAYAPAVTGNALQQPAIIAPIITQPVFNTAPVGNTSNTALGLISEQLNILARQIALMQGTPAPATVTPAVVSNVPIISSVNGTESEKEKDELTAEEKTELKKPFGATARIDTKAISISAEQQQYLDTFIKAYTSKTSKSKAYTQEHRSYMADPRVVSGFKPYTKEMVYSIVIRKSDGCYLWDIDGNQYVDALNGFGSNFLGYQAPVLKAALKHQVDEGYEIGPQHELSGEVARLICELTDSERAGLCNTGSEAVLGAMRIARTVNNKPLIVAFTGAYHGINDEALVRGTHKLKTYPAASGILKDNVQNILVLDYGEESALEIIKERSGDIAGVLIEAVQSRRPEFQPIEFLKKLRTVTEENDIALIFDEVITGFRCHPGGAQALWGIKADIATYGKVVGGGLSIGVIAGKAKFLDALDGGYWQYGDDSKPEVGITYFAGTFVRHPLVLATAKASLQYIKEQGPALQAGLNEKTSKLADTLNLIAKKYRVPAFIAHFSSLWRVKFTEEYPYYELLFAVMRNKGIHIWDGFSCFLTAAHTGDDLKKIATVFEDSIAELCRAGFIPQKSYDSEMGALQIQDMNEPPVPGARLGKDRNGNAAWFVADENSPGQYLQIEK